MHKFKTLGKTFTKLSRMSQLTETARILSFKAVRRLANISHKLLLATEVWKGNFHKNSMKNLLLTEQVRLATQHQADSCLIYWCIHFWIKRDQLDVTCFIISLFTAQHVSDVNTSIIRSLRLICWVISWVVLFWFDVCCCYVVVVWYPYAGWSNDLACIRIPHHPSQTTK